MQRQQVVSLEPLPPSREDRQIDVELGFGRALPTLETMWLLDNILVPLYLGRQFPSSWQAPEPETSPEERKEQEGRERERRRLERERIREQEQHEIERMQQRGLTPVIDA